RESMKGVGSFVSGFMLVCLLLGYYNFYRFGSFLETGRTVSLADRMIFRYGCFVPPWKGLYGLLLSPSKGILLFCPAIILGILSWRSFHSRHPVLSYTLAGAVLFRITFIASRSDWHGGFCLGPRYLLMLVPFLLIPVGFWLQEQLHGNKRTGVGLFIFGSLICISQQIYFSIGEIFSYNHIIKWGCQQAGIPLFDDKQVYMSWSLSPLFHLLTFKRGPYLLQGIEATNMALWIIATIGMWTVLGIGFRFLFAPRRRAEPGADTTDQEPLRVSPPPLRGRA
ncbi:MAG: hypothetical protein JSV16_16730, partial [Candidatus Hydrogenedentota bacterium]